MPEKLIFALAALLLAGAAAAQSRIICWTDENGRRACGDRVPPQYADRERQIYDERGRVVGTRARQLTAEERAEAARRTQEEARERAKLEEQGRYDSFLLQAYESVDDIVAARDGRVRVVNGRLRLLEKAISDGTRALTELKARAGSLVAQQKPVPARLDAQIAEFEDSLAQQRDAAQRMREERAAIVQDFERDLARYRALRGLPEAPVPEPPPLELPPSGDAPAVTGGPAS